MPGVEPIKRLEDLSGKVVYVRKSSRYFESLTALNKEFAASGKPAVEIEEADENLETEDILEMANAGLIPITLADDYLAAFWSRIFTTIKVNEGVFLREKAERPYKLKNSRFMIAG